MFRGDKMNLLINLFVVFLIFWFLFSLFLIIKSYFINKNSQNSLRYRKFFCGFMLGTPLIFLFLLVLVVVSNPIVQGVKAATIEARFEIIEKDDEHLVMKSPLTNAKIVYHKDNRAGNYISNFENRKVGEEIYIFSYRPTVLPMNFIVWCDYKVRGLPTNRTFSDQLEVVQKYSENYK